MLWVRSSCSSTHGKQWLIHTRGIVNSFGTFQAYYKAHFLSNRSSFDISWIGSVQACLTLILSQLVGPLYDMGFMTILVWIGAFLVTFGMMMTSLCTRFYQVLLAQGFCIGIGSSLLYIPSVMVCVTHCRRRKGLALGISSVGSSLGSIIYPIVFNQTEPAIGFGYAFRVMGFLALGTFVISLALIRHVSGTKEIRPLLLLHAFREPSYAWYVASEFFCLMGIYVPYYYVTSYASGPSHMSEDLSPYMVPILKATSIVGRLVPALLSDYFGPLNMYLPMIFASAVLNFGWIGIHSPASIIVYDVLYGITSGTVVAITPAVVAEITSDPKEVGTRIGMSYFVGGLGMLVGPPVAGRLLDMHDGSYYLGVQLFSACIMCAATMCLVMARAHKAGWHVLRKA